MPADSTPLHPKSPRSTQIPKPFRPAALPLFAILVEFCRAIQIPANAFAVLHEVPEIVQCIGIAKRRRSSVMPNRPPEVRIEAVAPLQTAAEAAPAVRRLSKSTRIAPRRGEIRTALRLRFPTFCVGVTPAWSESPFGRETEKKHVKSRLFNEWELSCMR
jgi:hypothetical protein